MDAARSEARKDVVKYIFAGLIVEKERRRRSEVQIRKVGEHSCQEEETEGQEQTERAKWVARHNSGGFKARHGSMLQGDCKSPSSRMTGSDSEA